MFLIFSGSISSGLYVTISTTFIFDEISCDISSIDSSSAYCKSSRQKQRNLCWAKTRRTSRKVFINLRDLVDDPARKKSCGLCVAMPTAILYGLPLALEDTEESVLLWSVRTLLLYPGFSAEERRPMGLSGPSKCAGSPRIICSRGQTGLQYCFKT